MEILKKYKDNKEYITHQLEKTLNPKVIKAHRKNRQKRIEEFGYRFNLITDFPRHINILCVGSRYGEEVQALRNMGFGNAVGIDLTSFPPYTIKMDMHSMSFQDDMFTIIYTNSLDHSNDLKKVIGEMIRVLDKKNGLIIIELELYNTYGEYETISFDSIMDIKKVFDSFNVKYGFRDVQLIRYINYKGHDTFPFFINNEEHTLMIYFNQGREDDKTD